MASCPHSCTLISGSLGKHCNIDVGEAHIAGQGRQRFLSWSSSGTAAHSRGNRTEWCTASRVSYNLVTLPLGHNLEVNHGAGDLSPMQRQLSCIECCLQIRTPHAVKLEMSRISSI